MNENISGPDTGPVEWLIMLIAAIIMIIPFWRIFSKAGYSGWLSFLMLLPLINLILLYFLAFANWPILRGKENQPVTTDRTPPPSTTA